MHISVEEFKDYCKKTKAFYEKLLKQTWLRDCSLMLSYEDLAEDAQGVFEESVFPFLKKPFVPIRNGMVKQNTKELREIVENYKEIEAFLRQPWARQEYSFERYAHSVRRGVTHVA